MLVAIISGIVFIACSIAIIVFMVTAANADRRMGLKGDATHLGPHELDGSNIGARAYDEPPEARRED